MPQFLRPDSNVTQTSYTGGFAEIDETTANDADLAFGANNSNTPRLEVGLSNPTTPATGTCTVRWRSARRNGDGSLTAGNSFTGTCAVYQGTTLIASDAYATGNLTTRTFTFNTSSITDWTNVRLRFTQTASGGDDKSTKSGLAVTWAEIEIPDPPIPDPLLFVIDRGSFTLDANAIELTQSLDFAFNKLGLSTTFRSIELVLLRLFGIDRGSFTLDANSINFNWSAVFQLDKLGLATTFYIIDFIQSVLYLFVITKMSLAVTFYPIQLAWSTVLSIAKGGFAITLRPLEILLFRIFQIDRAQFNLNLRAIEFVLSSAPVALTFAIEKLGLRLGSKNVNWINFLPQQPLPTVYYVGVDRNKSSPRLGQLTGKSKRYIF